jgi:hypothetical protein
MDSIPAPPKSLLISQLMATHDDYDADKIKLYNALYAGGDEFDCIKDKYLRYRQLELRRSAGGKRLREARLAAAPYGPRVAGIANFLINACLKNPPKIIATMPQPEPEKSQVSPDASSDQAPERLKLEDRPPVSDEEQSRLDYYNDLNDDCDGTGTTLWDYSRSLLRQMIVQQCGYLTLNPPDPTIEADSEAQQKQDGQFDIKFGLLNASDMLDQASDKEGLAWVKVYTKDSERPSMFLPPNKIVHTWRFINREYSVDYIAEQIIDDDGNVEEFDEDDVAVAQDPVYSDLKTLPIIPVEISDLHLFEQLAQPALAVWNREASITYNLDSTGWQQMVLKTSKTTAEVGEIVTSEDGCVVVETDGDLKYAAPTGDTSDALEGNLDKLIIELYEIVTAGVLQQSGAGGGKDEGRRSGKSKQIDYQSLSYLVSAFATTLKRALRCAIDIIQDLRGDDDITVSVEGLDDYDTMSDSDKVDLATAFLALPGMPPAAVSYFKEQLCLSLIKGAPQDVIQQIRDQSTTMKKQDLLDYNNPPMPSQTATPGSDQPNAIQSAQMKDLGVIPANKPAGSPFLGPGVQRDKGQQRKGNITLAKVQG